MEEDKKKTVKEVPSMNSVKSVASASSAQLNNKFIEEMKRFYDKAKKVYDKQDELFKSAEKEFEKAVLLYGEDPKNITPEEFFGIFAKFTQAYVAAKIDNETALAKEESERKREEAKKVL
jgi:dishevelled associated activator of morphogenesis